MWYKDVGIIGIFAHSEDGIYWSTTLIFEILIRGYKQGFWYSDIFIMLAERKGKSTLKFDGVYKTCTYFDIR